MDEGQDTTEQGFVEQLEGMTDEEVSANFFDLFNEVLDQYPEDK